MWIWIWLGITALSLIIEFISLEMVSVWFVAGGLVAMILAACGVSVELQWIVFILISVILLLSLRKIALKLLNKNDNEKTNVNAFVGGKYKLITGISEENKGAIKVNGIEWNAVSESEEEIAKGTIVEVVSISGNKVVVKKVESINKEKD